ncbi:MAG: Tat pathway signal protein [Rhodobacteraceae bacterium]|nr:Tat pathway signal protein [Paracoccaceae bacterium]
MTQLNRRMFLASAGAAASVRLLPSVATNPAARQGGRWVLKLVYDKSLGMMRAVERFIP